MTRRPCRNHSSAFKAKVALAAIRGEKTLGELASQFVERVWRSVKYEEVYVKAYVSVSEARQAIGKYFSFYNSQRPHSSLSKMTPDEYYFSTRPLIPAVA